jgi:hypothetical protein
MGLIGGMARTAVVAGTATAVSNRVSRRQAARWEQQGTMPQTAYAAPPPQYAEPPPPPPPPAPGAQEEDMTDQLAKLANLHSQGILSDAEFAAAKAKLLGI